MKVLRKAACFTITIAMFLTMTAGCSKKDSGNETANEAKSDAKTSENSGGDGPTITMMMNATETDAIVKNYNSIVENFNKDNTFGSTLEISYYENEQYKTKLTTLMASNEVPDIFFTWELDYLKPFVEGGKVLELTDMMAADKDFSDRFQEGVLEPLTYDGSLYAVPSTTTFTPMFYNKEIFEEHSLEVPKTWDEFIQICEVLKAAGITPISIPAPDAWIPAQFVQQLSNGIGGIEVYNGLLDGSEKWNNETFIQAGELVQSLIDADYLQSGFLGMSTEEGQMLFRDGKCAMYFMGSWEVSALTADECAIKDVVSAFPMPAFNEKNANIHVGSVDISFGIAADSEYPDAAFDFIKFWTSKESMESLLYEAGRMPCVKLDIDSSKVSPLMLDCIAIADSSVGLTPWFDRAFGAGEGVEFNNTVQSIYGGETPSTAFGNLQRYVEDNM